MKKIACILQLTVLLFSVLHANNSSAKDYRHIDSIMRLCPARHSKSAEKLAKYIAKQFRSENDRLRAAYSWVAQHVGYDVAKMYDGITYKHESEVVRQVLKTRKTVCTGYVLTFKAITENLGLKIFEVKGCTKQNGKIDAISHVWCAVKHGDRWLLIDPTWSSGYVASGVFNKRFNDKWYLVSPGEIIKSHIPFDPLWQFSYFPLNNNEFAAGKKADSITSRFFSYPDTVKVIEKQSKKEYLIASNRRTLSMKSNNSLTTRYVNNNKSTIEHLAYNENVDAYNEAANLYNLSASLYKKKKNREKALLKLDEALTIVNRIKNPDKSISGSIRDLKEMINKLESKIIAML
ncbi:MAG: hypothetical protein LBK97_05875 [Prevotellaceae bacterium]|jgi:hypothetical protein|nr:hypothetical protein [Prevotellaceae bacterium]